MTAPYDINPRNESWTYDEMKLRKKGGWSKQYSAALSGNTGWMLWNRVKPISSLSVGSSPAPDLQTYGGVRLIWNGFSDNSDHTIDTELDWRDRSILFQGLITGDSVADFSLSGSNNGLVFGGAGADASPTPDAMRPNGTGPAWQIGYTKTSTPLEITIYDGGGTPYTVSLRADASTGALILRAYAAPTNTRYLVGHLFFTPQLGYKNS